MKFLESSEGSIGRKAGLWGASALAIVLASPVMAQETDAAEPTVESEADAAPSGPAIIVTGSRIKSVNQFNSPDPLLVIDPAIASKEGKFDLASTLQSSPIAAGSTQITAAISSNFVTDGGPGAQTIDLRGLGASRTLVLLNGRRAGPAGTRGAVSAFDLNVLPQSIAANIQVLKSGASSIYGSDAIAGVVNIFTKSKLDGLEISGNVSAPLDSGGESYRINAIYGKTFDRGHFLIAGDYNHVNELKRGDRDYLACPEAYYFTPDGARADLIDPRTGSYRCEDLSWGHVWTYNLIGNMQLDGPGGPNSGVNTSPNGETVLLQYQYPGENLGIPAYGAPAYFGDFGAPAGFFPVGYSGETLAVQNSYHPFVEQQTMIPETDLYTIYAEGAYEVTDSVELFGEFLFNRRETYQNGWRQFWNFGWSGDLYGTGSVYNTWGDGFEGINFISPTPITDQADSSQTVDYYRGVGGLRGDFGGDSSWNWEVYGQYSRSVGKYRNQQILQDAYDSGYFQYSSCVGTTLPVSGKACIDIPWADPLFLRGELTPEQIDFLFEWEEGKTVYTQLSGEATLTGSVFELPAGLVNVAMGATVRRDEINDTPGELTRAGNAWGTSTSGITAGDSITAEAYGEINVPLLADKPFFKELTLTAAGRVTNVKSTRASDGASASDNGNFTYKIAGNWAVNDTLRFRASYGTSFRAPALFEQFLANETSSVAQRRIDPCIQWGVNLGLGNITQRVADNCAADGVPITHPGGGVTATVTSQGGLGLLKSETSRSYNVGAILTPRFSFLPDTRINIAVDYFDIKVDGEVSQLGSGTIVNGCYSSEDFPNDPLCGLFTRGLTAAPFNIATVSDQYINIATQQNKGVDLSINIRQDLGKLGALSLTGDMTWQTMDDFQLLPTSVITSTNGEAGSPKWVGDFRMNWLAPGGFSVFYGMNVIGGTSNVDDFLDNNGGQPCINSVYRGVYCPLLTADAVFYHNISVTQEIGDQFEITAGVSNLLDTRPPRVSTINGSEIQTLGPVMLASQYSFVGRRAFINVKTRF